MNKKIYIVIFLALLISNTKPEDQYLKLSSGTFKGIKSAHGIDPKQRNRHSTKTYFISPNEENDEEDEDVENNLKKTPDNKPKKLSINLEKVKFLPEGSRLNAPRINHENSPRTPIKDDAKRAKRTDQVYELYGKNAPKKNDVESSEDQDSSFEKILTEDNFPEDKDLSFEEIRGKDDSFENKGFLIKEEDFPELCKNNRPLKKSFFDKFKSLFL